MNFDVWDLKVINLAMTSISSCRRLAGVILLAGWLSGCAGGESGGADNVINMITAAPGKYLLYNCEQIGAQANALAARQNELQALKAKAEVEADGRLISAIAYGPEYYSTRVEIKELRREAAAKNCKALPIDTPLKPNSDSAIR